MFPVIVSDSLESLKEYCRGLGVFCKEWDDELLMTTFIHKSYAADFRDTDYVPDNERLEFLGDSVLGCIIADQLYNDLPNQPESKLTLKKIALVQEKTLAEAAKDIDLGTKLFLWRGEKKSWGAGKDSVLSDWLEALIGYIYLVAGYKESQKFVLKTVYPYLDKAVVPLKSAKSIFQELIQQAIKEIPEYEDIEDQVEPSGNVLVYKSIVSVLGTEVAHWYGPSKKKAQAEAANKAILWFEEQQQWWNSIFQ